MSDLIDREAVMEIILMPQNVSITEQLEMLKKLPSAEPEAKPPKWVAEDRYIKNHFKVFPHCPQCNAEVTTGQCYCMICGQHIDWSNILIGVKMMNDLIDRQSAINAIENTDCELSADAWDELTDAIMQLPSAEPKTAVWVGEGDGYVDGEIILDTWYCSNCDYLYDYEEKPNWKYCPNCGAKMEVGK